MEIGNLIKVFYNEFVENNSNVIIKTGIFKGIKQIKTLNFLVLNCDELEILIPEARLVRIENMQGKTALFCPHCKYYNWYDSKDEPPKSCKRCREEFK